MALSQNQQAFFELVRAGLWEKDARLAQFRSVDYSSVIQLAEEQSVVGLVTAGLEHVSDVKVPQKWLLQFIGNSLQIEQRNKAMNVYVTHLIDELRKEEISAILLKGQGVAQCYERPLWRSCGDIDLLLSASNYEKAKRLLLPLSTAAEDEAGYSKHLEMTINSWIIEIHGSLRCNLSKRIDNELDKMQNGILNEDKTRLWTNGNVNVNLPDADSDIIFVFTHFLSHFFKGGIGLRQICDWCRLLWIYKNQIDIALLEKHLYQMKLVSEWKAFASLAVDYLGMPTESLPLYSPGKFFGKKASRIMSFILETGNFGHNRDKSYYQNHSFFVYKAISLWRNTKDSFRHMMIFPIDAIRVWLFRLGEGVRMVIKGK